MDLHVVGPLASPAERAAVDAVLGPTLPGWARGSSAESADGQAARGGRAARERRTLLLPALHSLQDRIGHISAPALNYICRRLTIPPAEAYGVATFYALLSTKPRPPAVAHVCDDIACRLSGAEMLCADLARSLGPAGAPALHGRATWLRSPCLGRCEQGPAALLTVAGDVPQRISIGPVDAAAIVARLELAASATAAPDEATGSGGAGDASVGQDDAARLTQIRRSVPQAGDPGLRLLARVGRADPTSLEAYRANGGYRALANAIELGPEATIAEVTASKLVGRGGAAFPTGRKWAAVRAASGTTRYVVCNADESEPGTFKDRILLEEDPFAVVEAMTIEAFVVGATIGFVYIRGEYPLAESRITSAVAAARAAGLLGANVMGSSHAFEIEVRRGAGAYVCGEETALFESIEGHRGEPRNKPPYPVELGLFGQPTAINNVETMANVLLILGGDPGPAVRGESAGHGRGGGERYAATGTPASTGPKLFCLSGNVIRPGLYEVPFGATLGQLIDLAGGVSGGRAVRSILLGGAAGTFVGPDALEVPLTFEGTRAIGAGLGSGAVMVFDEAADLPGTLRRIAQFFRDESCGQCVPCRVGSVRQEELLARLAAGSPTRSREEELGILRDLGQVMRDASICGLGQTASSAIESALRTDAFATF